MLNEVIIGRPLLQDSGSEDAFKLVRRWLKACREDQRDHAKCKMAFSSGFIDETTPPELPLRVIDVEGLEGMHSPRLIESKGIRARYVALSHCWGPPERPPLRTTISNLQDHLQQINWPDLPKTFKDAITTVREIGLQYIWIDSLCIVQDDQEEWLRESVKMGSIYERADLTIAASHSPDSWYGLFLPRSASPTVELPHFLEDQQTSTKVFATVRREQRDDTFPELGPLSKRAWATQEWLLSRRIVFYTNGQLIWSCKSHTQRETGEKFYCTARDTKWKNIIEQYSDRQLTHLTDRLIALEGLKTEFERKTRDLYLHGLWKNALPDQLLWQVTKKVYLACNPLNLPSWTWASIPCGVRFLHIAGAKNLCTSIKADGDKGLIIKAMVKQIEVLQRASEEVNDWKELEDDNEDGERMKEVERTPSLIARDIENSNAKQTVSLHWSIHNAYGDNLGWAVFDLWVENPASKSLFCLALMGSLPRRDEEKERRIGISISKKPREYWILVLEPYEGGAYKRVGVGKIYVRGWWQDAAIQEVSIL